LAKKGQQFLTVAPLIPAQGAIAKIGDGDFAGDVDTPGDTRLLGFLLQLALFVEKP